MTTTYHSPRPVSGSLQQPEIDRASLNDVLQDQGWGLQAVNWVFEAVTGESLVAAIITPITGDWSKIRADGDAWRMVGNAMNDMSYNLTDAVGKVRNHWDGEAAKSHEKYIALGWKAGLLAEMGVAQLIAKGFDTVASGAEALGKQAARLLDYLVNKLLEAAATVWLPVAGWIKAAEMVWNAYQIYRRVMDIIDTVKKLITDVKALFDAVGRVASAIGKLKDADSLAEAMNATQEVAEGARDVRNSVRDIHDDMSSIKDSASEIGDRGRDIGSQVREVYTPKGDSSDGTKAAAVSAPAPGGAQVSAPPTLHGGPDAPAPSTHAAGGPTVSAPPSLHGGGSGGGSGGSGSPGAGSGGHPAGSVPRYDNTHAAGSAPPAAPPSHHSTPVAGGAMPMGGVPMAPGSAQGSSGGSRPGSAGAGGAHPGSTASAGAPTGAARPPAGGSGAGLPSPAGHPSPSAGSGSGLPSPAGHSSTGTGSGSGSGTGSGSQTAPGGPRPTPGGPGPGLPSPGGNGSGSGLPSPGGNGSGSGLPSPGGNGSGSGLPSPAGHGTGGSGSGLPSPAGHGTGNSGSGLPSPAGHGTGGSGSGLPSPAGHDSSAGSPSGAGTHPTPHDTKPHDTTPSDSGTKPHDSGTKPGDADGKPHDTDGKPHDTDTKPHDTDAKPHDTDTKPHDTDPSGTDDSKPHDQPDTPADHDGKDSDGDAKDSEPKPDTDAAGGSGDKDGGDKDGGDKDGGDGGEPNRSPKGHDLTPQFDNAAMASQGEGYRQQLEHILPNEADRERYTELSKKLTTELSADEARHVADVRNQIKVGTDDIVTKVLHPKAVEGYLPETPHAPGSEAERRQGTVAGSIARGVDVHDNNTPMGLREHLALDDKGAGWTPIPDKAESAMQLRYKVTDEMTNTVPFGGPEKKEWDGTGTFDPQKHYADAAEKAHYDAKAQQMADAGGAATPKRGQDPFTGSGSTGGGAPEWIASPSDLPDRAEIWQVNKDGSERLHAVYDSSLGWYQIPQGTGS